MVLGLDVGKTAHHGHGLTPTGKKVFDKPLPNSQPKLRAVFDKPTAKFGTVLVIVDQPVSIDALSLTVARDAGCKVAYLPGLAMRRIADLYPGEAKTDAKDVAVIADAARTLRSLELTDEITAELTVLTGFDQDLAAEATRTSNRIRGLLVVVPETGTPRRRHPVPGAGVHEQRRALEAQINALLEAHPLSPVLTSMPGVGVRTAAALLVTVGDGTGFPSVAHLASYAGFAPTTKSSGTSIHGEHAPRGGNRQLKRAMSPSTNPGSPRGRLHEPARRQTDADQHHVSSAHAEISAAPRRTASSGSRASFPQAAATSSAPTGSTSASCTPVCSQSAWLSSASANARAMSLMAATVPTRARTSAVCRVTAVSSTSSSSPTSISAASGTSAKEARSRPARTR